MRTEEQQQKQDTAKKLIKTGKQQDSKTYDDFSAIAAEEQERKKRNEEFKLKAVMQTILTRLERYTDTSSLRRRTAKWVMWIVSLWLLGAFVVVFLCGLKVLTLTTEVLIALLTTTTANILGLPYIILQGLYPKEKEKLKDKDKKKDNQQ